MRIHALATTPHYREHIEAVWKHLPDSLRGEARWGKGVNDNGWPHDDVVMVAGYANLSQVPNHRCVYVEHGAGQRYRDIKPAHQPYYHGSAHPERVIAYISPRKEVADAWGRPAFAAGAPVCDPYPLATDNERPVAAITFHWPALKICPEAGSSLEHYADALFPLVERLRAQGFDVIGHHHPRDELLPRIWRRHGVPIATVDQVRRHADLLIADNTSLMYEMCYLNRTVIALNCPEYRRNVNHGLRFWDWRGMEMDDPERLLRFPFREYIADSIYAASARHKDAIAAYDKSLSDGNDGLRAAAWLTSLSTLF